MKRFNDFPEKFSISTLDTFFFYCQLNIVLKYKTSVLGNPNRFSDHLFVH